MTRQLVPQGITPTLAIVDGTPKVNSVDVARHFGKLHKNVLRDIGNLQTFCDVEWYELNFEPIQIDTNLGKGRTRRDPAYNLTRDGFAMLAMGFTGEKAIAFKLAYIKAFNAMEAELSRLYVAPLTNDKQFRAGIPLNMKFKLQEQGQKIMGLLVRAEHPAERRNLYWQLRQVNDALGIPTESMEALGIAAPALERGAA